jgi:hypothetical protein
MEKNTAQIGLGGEGKSEENRSYSFNAHHRLNQGISAETSLDALTEKLGIIADWRDGLRQLLAHAANDVWDWPDIEHLKVEVARFKLACKGARAA